MTKSAENWKNCKVLERTVYCRLWKILIDVRLGKSEPKWIQKLALHLFLKTFIIKLYEIRQLWILKVIIYNSKFLVKTVVCPKLEDSRSTWVQNWASTFFFSGNLLLDFLYFFMKLENHNYCSIVRVHWFLLKVLNYLAKLGPKYNPYIVFESLYWFLTFY